MTPEQRKTALASALASIAALTALVSQLQIDDDPPKGPAWVSGDLHVHTTGCAPESTPIGMVKMMDAADIEIGAALLWGLASEADQARFTGRDDPASTADHKLHYDLEVSQYKAAQFGHLVGLGLSKIDFSPSPKTYPGSGIPIARWARDQGEGVLLGMAHIQMWPYNNTYPELVNGKPGFRPYELPILVGLGLADFMAVESSPEYPVSLGPMALWSAFLNSGFRVSLIGSTDYPCISPEQGRPKAVGSWRTLALVDGDRSYQAFLDAVRAGKTQVSLAGNLPLEFTVDGVPIGGEIRILSGQKVDVRVSGLFDGPAQVLLNGSLATTLTVQAGQESVFRTWGFSKSAWLAVRTKTVQTGAIYVIVDGLPIRSQKDSCYLAGYVDHLSWLVSSGAFGESAKESLGEYARAKFEFLQRSSGSCN